DAERAGAVPGRSPEPTPAHLGDLMRVVSDVRADLGIAHDGDADRATFVDDKGAFVVGDKALALLARAAVKGRGGTVVTPVSTSSVVEDVVRASGGKLIRTRVGSPIVARAIVEPANGRKVESTDEVKILESDGAVVVRPSGTEPIFRVYAEAKTPARADALAEEGVSWIKKALGHR